jgi:hypothetical protein
MKKKAPMHGGYELGKTYRIAYWQQNCTVLAVKGEGWDWSVTVQWDDGRIGTHCTPLDKRDKEVKNDQEVAKNEAE